MKKRFGLILLFFCAIIVFVTTFQLVKELLHVDVLLSEYLADLEGQDGSSKLEKLIISRNTIEKDSQIYLENLADYLFLANISPEVPVEKIYEGLDIEVDPGLSGNGRAQKAYANRTIKLPNLMVNNCRKYRCFQHRIPFKNIPSLFWRSLVGVEDGRFAEHIGIDWQAIFRALLIDIKKLKFVQGGSTITQQLVKNLFLSSEKKLVRKIKEAIYAIYLERRLTKGKILELYLNEFEWGVIQGVKIKGLYAAAKAYFQKRPEDLEAYEASILMALLNGPNFYNPLGQKSSERLRLRTNRIFSKLKKEMQISPYENSWNEENWKKFFKNLKRFNLKKNFFLASSLSHKKWGSLGNYEAFTLLKIIRKQLMAIKKSNDGDFAIKVLIHDLSKKNQENSTFFYYTKEERSQENAFKKELHGLGSLLKPIIGQVLMDEGLDPYKNLLAEGASVETSQGVWRPREAREILEEENLDLIRTIKLSRNRQLINACLEVGLDKIEKKLSGIIPRLQTPLAEFPAQLLGAINLSMLEIMDLFKKFYQDQCDLEFGDEEAVSLLSKLSDPSSGTIQYRLGSFLKDTRFFYKTGTSNNGLDALFVAIVGKEIFLVWAGYEGPRRDKKYHLSGSSSSFPIFRDFVAARGKRFRELSCGN